MGAVGNAVMGPNSSGKSLLQGLRDIARKQQGLTGGSNDPRLVTLPQPSLINSKIYGGG